MTNMCLYFQVHQPFRLKQNYSIFDIGKNNDYFDDEKNKQVMQKIANKCYLPANKILLDLIKKYDGRFKVSFSITGTALEQFELYAPEVLESFKELAYTGCVEFLSETYHHSLAFLYDEEEFAKQVALHQEKIRDLFKARPIVFRNTELIYNNELAFYAEKMGYKAVLAEGADHVLGWKSPNFVYKPKTANIKLLLKNYRLSDDIAFRFSNKQWGGYPLTARKYANWIAPITGDSVNLFIDYETFGEHQWQDTGIFNFLKQLPYECFKRNIGFHTPSDLVNIVPKDELDINNSISWADIERDLSAWTGNKMQNAALAELYRIKNQVFATNDKELIKNWRKLTTSDHFYYMCTKWFNDGDVHKYFNPYETPYDCFIAFMNVLEDIKLKIGERPTIFSSLKRRIFA